MKMVFTVEGMSCQHCVKAVKNALSEVQGVKSVEVDLAAKKVEVEGDNLQEQQLKDAIQDAGYEVI